MKLRQNGEYVVSQLNAWLGDLEAGRELGNVGTITLAGIQNALDAGSQWGLTVGEEWNRDHRTIYLMVRGKVTMTAQGKEVKPRDLLRQNPLFWADLLGL